MPFVKKYSKKSKTKISGPVILSVSKSQARKVGGILKCNGCGKGVSKKRRTSCGCGS